MRLVGVPNRAPSVEQLLQLAGRAGGQALRSAEVATLKSGISALADAAGAVAPVAPAPVRVSERERLFEAAVRLYAGVYGLTPAQAEAEIRAEAGP